ncbi:MAG TPA: hypothetical protein DIT89_09145, partial [Planctomycetaceae bacterium]|nr:hypothetical protein [Planctomycetaceae bacterium]
MEWGLLLIQTGCNWIELGTTSSVFFAVCLWFVCGFSLVFLRFSVIEIALRSLQQHEVAWLPASGCVRS